MSKLPENLPALLRAAGLSVVVVDGWEDRGRPPSTGGFEPVGSLNHHTGASASGWTKVKELAYAKWMFLVGRGVELPAPLCQIALGRSGTVYLGAAGRANHAGTAKPSGSVSGGDGNALYIGTEWMLSGTEAIPPAMYAAGVTLNAVLTEKVTKTSVQTISCHYNTSITGKWDIGDPNGIVFNGARVLDVPKFRNAVAARRRVLYGQPVAPSVHDAPKIPTKGVVLAKGPSDHKPFVRDLWFNRKTESRFRVGFWNVHHGTTAKQARPTFMQMKTMGVDLIIMNEVKRHSGILSLLREMGYGTAYNDPEFAIAWRKDAFEFRRDNDLVLSEENYWLDRNEALSVILEHKATGLLLRVISEHPPAHISRPDHATFDNVLEVHKDIGERNAKIANRTKIAALIARDSNIDPVRDRPVHQGNWRWAYEGWKYVRSPEPTFGSRRHIDEMLVNGLRTRRI